MKHAFYILNILMLSIGCFGQDYDYYFIGDTSDIQVSPQFGICMMGGATENDEGARWFIEKANQGNILVLRASGSDGYNDYFYSQLGLNPQSVETIVFNNASASEDPFVLDRISQAEAIWFAGGNQAVYESYWKNSSVETLINQHINAKQYPIGGTSAGMAILGEYYFSATNGTISSSDALNNPLDNRITVSTEFLNIPFLSNTITDTHYDNPERIGRHTVFMSRLLSENNTMTYGIAADEFVAICIDNNGIAKVFGEHPNYDDFAYFLRLNCDLRSPQNLSANTPLIWGDSQNEAIKACKIPGTINGDNNFDLNEWKNIDDGEWSDLSTDASGLILTPNSFESCNLSIEDNQMDTEVFIYPNPVRDLLHIKSTQDIGSISLISPDGRVLYENTNTPTIQVASFSRGIYHLMIEYENGSTFTRKIIIDT